MDQHCRCGLSLAAMTMLGVVGGCGTSRQAQLERVAKDWCETIRASQVIPVYPLTEDLQPGDVYLVQVPVDRQQEIYRTRGFLPLDNHIARLDPTGYADFYERSFLSGDGTETLPKDWQRPGGVDAAAWRLAPNAAFPTYTFAVNQSQGFNLAIPISGVPVGLSMLGTQSATGSVSIKKSSTLGIDSLSLFEQLEAWADLAPNRRFLSNFASPLGKPPRNYLRVITRIYTTGELDVQLTDARAVGAAGDAGLARPVDLFLPTLPDESVSSREAARDSYQRGLAHLNNMANSRGTPMSLSGEDSGLSAEEVEARTRARAEELEKQKKAAKEAAAEKKQAAADAKEAGASEASALRTAKHEHAVAKREEAAAAKALNEARRRREALPPDASDADKSAADEAVRSAETAQQAAKATLDTKQTALDGARAAYKPKADAIAKADVELAAANAALERLEGFAPGASFRFNAASARSVSLSETFDPPLIIGYLAFDVPVLTGGGLGRPIPTHALIDPAYGVSVSLDGITARSFVDTGILDKMYGGISEDNGPTATSIRRSLDSLTDYLPGAFRGVEEGDGTGTYKFVDRDLLLLSDGTVNFRDYLRYRELRAESRDFLERIRDARNLQVPDGTGGLRPGLKPDYEQLERDLRRFRVMEPEATDFDEARRALIDYYRATSEPRRE